MLFQPYDHIFTAVKHRTHTFGGKSRGFHMEKSHSNVGEYYILVVFHLQYTRPPSDTCNKITRNMCLVYLWEIWLQLVVHSSWLQIYLMLLFYVHRCAVIILCGFELQIVLKQQINIMWLPIGPINRNSSSVPLNQCPCYVQWSKNDLMEKPCKHCLEVLLLYNYEGKLSAWFIVYPLIRNSMAFFLNVDCHY